MEHATGSICFDSMCSVWSLGVVSRLSFKWLAVFRFDRSPNCFPRC